MKTHLRARLPLSLLAILLVGALAATACDTAGSDETTTTEAPPTTIVTTTTVTTTTLLEEIPSELIPGETSPSIDAELAEVMRAEIGDLILVTEESRGLPFITIPTVTILDEADFTDRVRNMMEEELDPIELAREQAVLELLGMLDGSIDLHDFLIELFTEQVAGFYDSDERELVIPVSADGITPFQRVTIVHELVHALTDQHFEFSDALEVLYEEYAHDEAAALLALVEGDATYLQFLFFEQMSLADASKAIDEMRAFDMTLLENAPLWIQQDLAFPYQQGMIFAGFLVNTSGLKGLDEAYLDPPISTEQILHPEKYLRNEQPTELEPLTVTLDGWELFDEGTYGEWGIRMWLVDSLQPGVVTQAAAGWGNDHSRTFIQGDDVAIAWVYSGETIQDAEDLVNALIEHVRATADVGEPKESGGGLLFEGDSKYVFIDRVDEKIYFVTSTDVAAGESLRDQLGV